MKKVTIVIPVYNRERLIKKCLHSLTTQSYEKLEIIVVDNNSDDNTALVVKKCAREDDRIKYCYCKKQGVSIARNYGIEKATGEYISFIDSDDYCLPDMFQDLVAEAEKNDADITVCDIKIRDESGRPLAFENPKTQYYGSDCVKKYLCGPTIVCGKLIKLQYLNEHHIRFRGKSSLADDLAFVVELAAYTRKISFVKKEYYVCISHNDSLIRNIEPEREYQIFEALKYVYDIYANKVKLLDKYHAELERMVITSLVLDASRRYMLPEKDKRFYAQATSFLRTHFSKWYRNKYYAKCNIKTRAFFCLYHRGRLPKMF